MFYGIDAVVVVACSTFFARQIPPAIPPANRLNASVAATLFLFISHGGPLGKKRLKLNATMEKAKNARVPQTTGAAFPALKTVCRHADAMQPYDSSLKPIISILYDAEHSIRAEKGNTACFCQIFSFFSSLITAYPNTS